MTGSVAKYRPDGWAAGADTGSMRKLGSDGEVLARLSYLPQRSSDPPAPPNGTYTIWMSDGTESGDPGDVMIAITSNGVTKIGTLIDFSTMGGTQALFIQMSALSLASSAVHMHSQPVYMSPAVLASSAPNFTIPGVARAVSMGSITLASSPQDLGVNFKKFIQLPHREITVLAPDIQFGGAATQTVMDTLALSGSAPDLAVIQDIVAFDALSGTLTARALTVVAAAGAVAMDSLDGVITARKLNVYAPPSDSLILQDSFTDTGSTQLQSHTSDSGHSWTRVGGTGNMVIDAGGTYVTCSGLSGYLQYTADPAEHVRQLKVDWYSGNQFYNLRVMFRVKDNDDYLCVNIYAFGNDYDIQKCVTGGYTNLATSAPTLAASTWYTMWIEDNPSTDEIKVYHATRGSSKPGSAQVSVTDSTWSGETGVGLRPQRSTDRYDELYCWNAVEE